VVVFWVLGEVGLGRRSLTDHLSMSVRGSYPQSSKAMVINSVFWKDGEDLYRTWAIRCKNNEYSNHTSHILRKA
jgi:hypothetical protein